MKLPIVIAEFIKYALLFLKNLVGFGLFGVLLFAWVFSYLLHALRLAFCLWQLLLTAFWPITFFLPRRVKETTLLSFHVQAFAFCILEAGNMLLFICLYYPANTEEEGLVTSDARERKQGRQKSVLAPASSSRNVAERDPTESHSVWLSTKCSVLSSGEQDVVLTSASAFVPDSFLLRRSKLCCPSSSFWVGVLALLPLRVSVLYMFTAKDEAVEVVVFYSDNLHLHLPFLNKNLSFFEQKSLWMCAALSISSWRTISLSTRINLFSAPLLKLPTKLLLWLEQTMRLVVFTFFCCFSP